mmetsp:Transcript_545/g.1478  ORF Transcript_545/g.1478 Transcript_545/m.1478 type:complete len:230 (-) Transcript_545:40-729(-)
MLGVEFSSQSRQLPTAHVGRLPEQLLEVAETLRDPQLVGLSHLERVLERALVRLSSQLFAADDFSELLQIPVQPAKLLRGVAAHLQFEPLEPFAETGAAGLKRRLDCLCLCSAWPPLRVARATQAHSKKSLQLTCQPLLKPCAGGCLLRPIQRQSVSQLLQPGVDGLHFATHGPQRQHFLPQGPKVLNKYGSLVTHQPELALVDFQLLCVDGFEFPIPLRLALGHLRLP